MYRKLPSIDITAADLLAFVNTGAAGSAAGSTQAPPGDHDSNRHRQDDNEEEYKGEGKYLHEHTYSTLAIGRSFAINAAQTSVLFSSKTISPVRIRNKAGICCL